jgi:Spy/CpxP family protein refolding chaperone
VNNAKVIIASLAMVFLMAGVVYAETPGEDQHKGDGDKEGVFKELNLTPEQTKQLQTNRTAQREESTQLRKSMKEKQTELQEALKNPAVSRAAVEPIVNQIKSLQTNLIDYRINGIFAVKAILTPEQFAKFQQMTEKRQANRGEHSKMQNRERRWGERNQTDEISHE